METRLLPATILITVLALPACLSDPPTAENSRYSAELTATNNVTEDVLLSKIGRGLALALAERSIRSWVQSRIAASPYVEWRIPFRDILLMEADAPEVLRVFGLAGLTQAERLSEKMLPPLELYFPVAEHRIGWRAEAPIQVAVRIGRGDTYTLYQTDGSTSLTRGSYLPTTATLVLAPSEIDYTDRASALRGGTRTGPGMEAASTVLLSKVGATALPPEPEQPPPPPPTGGVSTNRHTHLSYFKTTRYHDD